MTSSYETNKKIANLTKIVYRLTVQNDEYKDDQTKHQNETLLLRRELIAKEDMINTLTTKLHRVEAQYEEANVIHKQNRVKDVINFKKDRDDIQAEFDKQMEQTMNANKVSIQSLEQSCSSLLTQLDEMGVKYDDQVRKHEDEINMLNETNEIKIKNLYENMDKEADRMRINHKKEIEILKSTLEDNYNSAFSQTHLQYQNKMVEMRNELQQSFDVRMLDVKEVYDKDIEELNIAYESVQTELTVVKQQLQRAHEEINSRNHTFKLLQKSTEQEIGTWKTRYTKVSLESDKLIEVLKSKGDAFNAAKACFMQLKEQVIMATQLLHSI